MVSFTFTLSPECGMPWSIAIYEYTLWWLRIDFLPQVVSWTFLVLRMMFFSITRGSVLSCVEILHMFCVVDMFILVPGTVLFHTMNNYFQNVECGSSDYFESLQLLLVLRPVNILSNLFCIINLRRKFSSEDLPQTGMPYGRRPSSRSLWCCDLFVLLRASNAVLHFKHKLSM